MKNRYLKMMLNMFVITLVFLCCQMAGYAAYSYFFAAAGLSAPWLEYLVSTLLGFALFVCVGVLVSLHIRYSKQWKEHNREHGKLLEETINALNRIAMGDFSVSVATHKHGPFDELAQSINQMAHELGSMEKLRQDFISNVSHEIQSPLTSIGGFAALLRNEDLAAAQRAHYIDIIEAESKRLSKLSDNLLKLSALEAGCVSAGKHEYRLDKQLEHTALLLEPQWAKKDISVEAGLQKISYMGDEDLLSQVWVNLLHNAIKFTPEGGSINVSLAIEGDNAVCRIADTGLGIASEDMLHIFERFYKADKARDRSLGGSGLGLSLVKKIVELHGGSVGAESEIGSGSVFTVILPLH